MQQAKRHLVLLAKIVLPSLLIVWLLGRIPEEDWQHLRDRPKDWNLLVLAFLGGMGAVCLTFYRWQILVCALEVPFRLRDAFRLGFLGYLFNFVAAGAVGGDLFKAFFIAHESPGKRTEAVASVVVDRVLGLYALLMLTGAVVLAYPASTPQAAAVGRLALVGVGLGGVAVVMMFVPGFTQGALSSFVCRIPKVGRQAERILLAVRLYRSQPGVVAAVLAISLVVHLLTVSSIYLGARALYSTPPTFREHCVIVPLSMVAGALPFTPAGLGTIELAMDELYRRIPENPAMNASGVTATLVYRLVTIVIAAIGVGYYWVSRRQVDAVLHKVEDSPEVNEVVDRFEPTIGSDPPPVDAGAG